MAKPIENKKIFGVRISDAYIKPLKHLAIDLNKSIGDLVEEAIQDVLKKYESKTLPKKAK